MNGRLSLALVRVEHGAGPIPGLTIPVFQCVKTLRDRPNLAWCWYSQVPSEVPELSIVLVEYESYINLLESLCNEHKALLDQPKCGSTIEAGKLNRHDLI